MKALKIFAILGFFFLLSNCKKAETITKDTIPTVSIEAVTEVNINFNSVKTSGFAAFKDEGTITARGICYGTSPNPTIAGSKTTETSDSFTTEITNLTAGTQYFMRAYATSNNETYYSDQVTFTTLTLAGTTWDFNIIYNASTSWHADVIFYADGTTKYDEPEYPGVYTSYGTWAIANNTVTYVLDKNNTSAYVFTGTLVTTGLAGTYTFTTPGSWVAVKKP